MTMPKLPHILEKLGSSQKEKKEFLWALLVWDDGIKSAIWTVDEGKTKVVALDSFCRWEGKDGKGLTEVVDKSFATCAQTFEGLGEEPEKVIFGLPESWTQDENIKKDRQALLQEVCRALEVTPVGFVSTFDAICHHLKKIEGIPLSAILIRPSSQKVLVAVSQVGKILNVEEVASSGDIAADTCEGLLRFGIEVLPSRILVFNSGDMEEARQNLTAFHWEAERAGHRKLPFLHFPKIEVLPADFDINAVCLAGGTEVAKSLGFTVVPEEEKKPVSKEEVVVPRQEKPSQEEETPEEVAIPEADLGFVRGEDVLLKAAVEEKVEEEIKPEEVVKETPEEEGEEVSPLPKGEPEVEEIPPEQEGKRRFPGFLFSFSALAEKLSQVSLPSLPAGRILIGVTMAILLIFGGAFLWFIWYFPKASVAIFVSPKTLEEEIRLTVDPTAEVVDEKEHVLPGLLVETEESGQKEKETTGQKTVGEPAKGEVTVFNRTSAPEVFDKGTILIGPGGLKFTLERDVAVASKTPDLESGVDKWGEAKVEVKAQEIGGQYNLASQSQFTLKDFPSSSFLAKNENAFTGGTSRQIQAVSEEDRKNLLDQLTSELEEKGKDSLLAYVPEGQKLIENSSSSQVAEEDFSHEAGDEAKSLSCKVKVKVSALSYNEEDFLKIAQKALEEKIPENYELRKEEVEARFEKKEKAADGSFRFRVLVKADLLPKLDTSEISGKIKGKRPVFAREYFASFPGFVDAEISLRPRLPSFLQFLPRSKEKIEIEIKGY